MIADYQDGGQKKLDIIEFIKALKISWILSLRKQPSFFAPGPSDVSREGRRPSRETSLGPGAKKDGCFRRLMDT